MLSGCWISAALLLLLSLSVTRAQSGDGDADVEPRISCTSDVLTTGSSLSCKLVAGPNANEDDEDYDGNAINNMTVCYSNSNKQRKCVEVLGDTVSDLSPVPLFTVIVQPKRGGRITATVDLKKILKPRRPRVKSVAFDQESDQAVIRIQTPYNHEYLKLDNQLFQLQIWTTDRTITQNISSDTLKIGMEHLQKHAEYHARVRAIPVRSLQGTWSEWSETFTFITPSEENQTHMLMLWLIILVVVPSCVVFFWKYKIFTYMWPSIPHPKHTLVQICNPNKSLLLNLKPEEFSALKVEKSEPCEESSISAAGADPSTPPCSSQTSSSCSRSTTSVTTEELELSALLSGSSSDGEDGLRAAGPSPVQVLLPGERPRTPQPEGGGGGHEAEAEAYVTMSSFYQIK